MMDYGAHVISNGYRALIPYNHFSNQGTVLVSPATTPPTTTDDISLGIAISMTRITLRRLLIIVSQPPSVPVTFRVYRRRLVRVTGGGIINALDPTALAVTVLPGTIEEVGESEVQAGLTNQIVVLVEPTTPPQNLGYVTASIAYEEQLF